MSQENRDDLSEYVQYLVGHRRARSTIGMAQDTIALADEILGGARVASMDRIAAERLMSTHRTRYAPTSTKTFAGYLKAFLNYQNRARYAELPEELKRALRVPQARPLKPQTPVTENEFRALLAAAGSRDARRTKFLRALLWTLWDTGFRSGELRALRVESAEIDEHGGCHLTIPGDAPAGMTKTGPRTCYVVESTEALRMWLAIHPGRADARAPLFPGSVESNEVMHAVAINTTLKRLSGKARVRSINPHLFRHTRATRAARGDPDRGVAGWSDAEMRGYFGWAAGSDMPSRYTHLARQDMEARVRADAAAGRREINLDAAVERIAERVAKRALQKMGFEPAPGDE